MVEINYIIIGFLMIIPSLAVHEYAHGKVADLLGDPTPHYHKRLTLNPMAHIDLFGTIILPLLLLMSGSPVFGYAKPVPVNPNFFKERKKGMAITGMAGPLANLSLAALIGVLFRTSAIFRLDALYYFASINIILAVFNLIPIPPLDGSKVLAYFIPRSYAHYLTLYEQYGMIILFVLIFILRDLFWMILRPPVNILGIVLIGGSIL